MKIQNFLREIVYNLDNLTMDCIHFNYYYSNFEGTSFQKIKILLSF